MNQNSSVRINKNNKFSKIIALFLLIIFVPMPIGFGLKELTLSCFIGLFGLVLFRSIKFNNIKNTVVLFLISSLATLVGILKGSDFSYFQYLRCLSFPILLILFLEADIKKIFFLTLDKLIPLIVLGAYLSLFFYFIIQSDLYNSTLSIPYEDALYKRIFIYPTYFFLILFIISVLDQKKSQFFYIPILASSGSKSLLLSMMLVYLYSMFLNYSVKKVFIIISALFILYYFVTLFGLFDRVYDFIEYGDPWRIEEPLAAIKFLTSDLIHFLIGGGSGLTYWTGRETFFTDFVDESRLIINSSYDIHNGFLTIAMRFGVPLAIFYFYQLYKKIPKIEGRNLIALVLAVNIYLSHGPVQLVEAIGLLFGIRLIGFYKLNNYYR